MTDMLVCKVGGSDYYGNEYEHKAARLRPGDRVIFKDSERVVERTWFYDGIVVDLTDGSAIHPELGDKFDLAPN